MAVDEPKYEVIKEYEEFELRKYSSFIIAETEVESDMEEAVTKPLMFFSNLFPAIMLRRKKLK